MAVEPRRGCGYRKTGGLYLMGGKLSAPCCKLPIPLDVCPTCGAGVKQSRGWTWINPKPFLDAKVCTEIGFVKQRPLCPAARPGLLGDRVGLIWIGAQFYPTAEHFQHEAATLGISRRIKAVPRGFVVGEHYVFFAHPKVFAKTVTDDRGFGAHTEFTAGIFAMFKPTHIEMLCKESDRTNEVKMHDLKKRGITPVFVPDDDPDHTGSVYDDDLEEALL